MRVLKNCLKMTRKKGDNIFCEVVFLIRKENNYEMGK